MQQVLFVFMHVAQHFTQQRVLDWGAVEGNDDVTEHQAAIVVARGALDAGLGCRAPIPRIQHQHTTHTQLWFNEILLCQSSASVHTAWYCTCPVAPPHLLDALVWRKRDADDGPHHLAVLDDLLHAAAHHVGRDGKADPARGAAGGVDGGVDSDHVAHRVQQRAAGAPGVDGSVLCGRRCRGRDGSGSDGHSI